LREISKAIDRLEKEGVPVPEALRGEKTRLAAQLDTRSRIERKPHRLAEELEAIVDLLNVRSGRSKIPKTGKKRPRKGPRPPKTDQSALREHILQALEKLGGRAKVSEVIEEMGHQLEGKLLPGDLEWRESTKEYVWQNNAKWERHRMTRDGVLPNDSPRGIWEIGERQP